MSFRLLLLLLLALPLAGGWTREAYVWQRAPGPVLAACPSEAAQALDGVALLAAEISWDEVAGRVVYSEIEYRAPALTRWHRVAFVVRCATPPGGVVAGSPACAALCRAVREVVKRADEGGLHPAEIQLDLDCPESGLAVYAEWLRDVRAECPGLPLVITALPAWLGRPGMAELANAADAFVLQVHSLDRPATKHDLHPLCDPARVPQWVEEAGRLARPFRVALPTFGYLLAFRPDGRFLAMSPGGPRASWPSDVRLVELRADEAEMAQLARFLSATHPTSCTGVFWFRMPGGDDARGWGWTAFSAVLSGEDPAPALHAECIQTSNTIWEIAIRNDGRASALAPRSVFASWESSGRALGMDSSGGYALRAAPDARAAEFVPLLRGGLAPRIEPGRRLVIGWVRLAGLASPEVSLEP